MYYYSGSKLPIEWTCQHGFGPNPELHSQIVIQYACEDTLSDNCGLTASATDDVCASPFYPDSSIDSTCTLRDGTPISITSVENSKRDVEAEERISDSTTDLSNQDDLRYGRHETLNYYNECKLRERNKGLWVSDQSVSSTTGARATRQDPNGNQRYGLECPEEAHYYPYWHWSPWKDVAVVVEDDSKCDYFKAQSQNVKSRNRCVCPDGVCTSSGSQPNNERACIAIDGTWCTDAAHNIDPPECVVGDFTRQNHLGNVGGTTNANRYEWTLPQVSTRTTCVLRVRYNISTTDGIQDGMEVTVDGTSAYNVGSPSPLYDNDNNEDKTYIDIAGLNSGATLGYAINTNQYGRTFQDRTYTFDIVPASEAGECADSTIYNLNVRGKRGNIVQAYPAVEYDFVPSKLTVTDKDCVHVQWTGSDYNPSRNGNDAEGGPRNPGNLARTTADRSNLVQMSNAGENFALADVTKMNMLDISTSQWARLIFIDQEYDNPDKCWSFDDIDAEFTNRADREETHYNCMKLSGARTPYFDLGAVRTGEIGTYKYMSTRNNNFSNRGQKGTLTVVRGGLHPAAITAIALVGVAAAGGLFFIYRRRRNGKNILPSRFQRTNPANTSLSGSTTTAAAAGGLTALGAGAAAFGSKLFKSSSQATSDVEGDFVVATYPHVAQEPGELSFAKGDHIKVLNRDTSGWWEGEAHGERGVFPANYVRTLFNKS